MVCDLWCDRQGIHRAHAFNNNKQFFQRISPANTKLIRVVLSDSRLNWNLEMLNFVEGGKPENPEKNPRSKGENQQQTQPTYDVRSRNQARDTLVEGEHSHHCATSAPQHSSLIFPDQLHSSCWGIFVDSCPPHPHDLLIYWLFICIWSGSLLPLISLRVTVQVGDSLLEGGERFHFTPCSYMYIQMS